MPRDEKIEDQVKKLIHEGRGFIDVLVYVKPEAETTILRLEYGDLVFYTSEPPVEGRANASLVRYFSRMLEIPTSRIEIVYGARSRTKRLRIHGVSANEAIEKIARAVTGGKQ